MLSPHRRWRSLRQGGARKFENDGNVVPFGAVLPKLVHGSLALSLGVSFVEFENTEMMLVTLSVSAC